MQLTKRYDEWNTEGPRPLYLRVKAKSDNIQYYTLYCLVHYTRVSVLQLDISIVFVFFVCYVFVLPSRGDL